MRDGAELWWEGRQKGGKSEIDSFEEEAHLGSRGISHLRLSRLLLWWGNRAGLGKVKSEDTDDHNSHRDTSLRPVPC